MLKEQDLPSGKLVICILAMPGNANANGDIFGGWLVSHMDMGGAIEAQRRSHSRVVTVAIDEMNFIHPVYVGDVVYCYANLIKVGNTSMQFKLECWTQSISDEKQKKVADGIYVYVAIDDHGKPQLVDR